MAIVSPCILAPACEMPERFVLMVPMDMASVAIMISGDKNPSALRAELNPRITVPTVRTAMMTLPNIRLIPKYWFSDAPPPAIMIDNTPNKKNTSIQSNTAPTFGPHK